MIKKIAFLSLLAIAGMSMAAESSHPSTILSPDIPPPSCAPDCPVSR